jgi:hypothetical protein
LADFACRAELCGKNDYPRLSAPRRAASPHSTVIPVFFAATVASRPGVRLG